MNVGITGCMGRVGSLLVEEIRAGNWNGMSLAGGSALPDEIPETAEFFITDDAGALFEQSDIVIDFTAPEATREHIKLAAEHKTALIIGTTGLSAKDESAMAESAKEAPILYAANMSVGVNVLLALVEQAAARLGDGWDIEIFEAHHKHKVDAPSGTALALGKAAATGRNVELDNVADYARHGKTGAREDGKIGFSVARGGDVVGDHRVFFHGEGEHIELNHIASDRTLFVKGALRGAQWLSGQAPGLYSMRDVLDL